MSDRIVIVDEHDTPISIKTYAELHYEDIYRVAALWLTDPSSGDTLLARRHWNKHNDPGKWGVAAVGTVDEGETYEQNIIKETEEEIGVHGLTLIQGPKQYIDDKAHRFFCQWYTATADKQKAAITMQESEVIATKWVPVAKLVKEVREHPELYVSSMMSCLQTLGIADKNGEATA